METLRYIIQTKLHIPKKPKISFFDPSRSSYHSLNESDLSNGRPLGSLQVQLDEPPFWHWPNPDSSLWKKGSTSGGGGSYFLMEIPLAENSIPERKKLEYVCQMLHIDIKVFLLLLLLLSTKRRFSQKMKEQDAFILQDIAQAYALKCPFQVSRFERSLEQVNLTPFEQASRTDALKKSILSYPWNASKKATSSPNPYFQLGISKKNLTLSLLPFHCPTIPHEQNPGIRGHLDASRNKSRENVEDLSKWVWNPPRPANFRNSHTIQKPSRETRRA